MSLQNRPLTAPGPGQPPAPPPSGRRARQIAIVSCLVGVIGVLVAAVVVMATGHDDPEDVAKRYLEAEFTADYETSCELLSEGSRASMLEAFGASDCSEYADRARDDEPAEFREAVDDLEVHVRIGAEVDGDGGYVLGEGEVRPEEDDSDAVTLEWAAMRTYTGDDPERAETTLGLEGLVDADEDEIDLVQEHGEWKVDPDWADGRPVG